MPPKLSNRKGSSSDPLGKTGRNGRESAESTCRDCNTPVHNKDKAIVCDLCEHWMHAECQDIPDATYAFLSGNEDSSIKWYCSHCKVIATGVVTEVGKIAKSYQEMDRRVKKLETQMKSKANEADLEQLQTGTPHKHRGQGYPRNPHRYAAKPQRWDPRCCQTSDPRAGRHCT